jgi:ankyrin repeat protein
MIDNIELLGEESQELPANHLVEMFNLLEVEWEWLPITLPINEINKQQAVDILLLQLTGYKFNALGISGQRLEVLKTLLKEGANVNANPNPYSTCKETESIVLEEFLSRGCIEEIELLLSYGANITTNMLGDYSWLPFYAKIRLLMNWGVDLNMHDSKGNILHRILDIYEMDNLHYKKTSSYIEFLLENGVNPNISDSQGIYPLDLAISSGNREAELALKRHNAKQSGQLLPIDPAILLYAEQHTKAAQGYYSLQDTLLSINEDKYYGIFNRDACRVAELLLEAGAIITEDMPIIAYASSLQNFNLVKLYLDHGANPNAVDKLGRNGLMIAVLSRNMPIINLLLNDGRVDINSTSIRRAEDEDEKDINLNVLDRALISEFWDSSIKADFEIARLLIKHGAIIGQAALEWYAPGALKELQEFQNEVQNSKDLLVKKTKNPYRELPTDDQPDAKKQEEDLQKTVPIYDISDTTTISGELFNFTFFANNSYYPTNAPELQVASGAVNFGFGYGARRALALGETVLSGVSAPVALISTGLATGLGLEYSSGQRYAKDVQRYTKLASTSNRDITITSADYVLANSRGIFDPNNLRDMESLELIALGIATERNNKQTSLWTDKSPTIDFKVMGRVDPQGHGGLVNPYFNIDSNANKPTILSTPIPYQPKSILFTPDDQDCHLEWSKLAGFTPSTVKLWQEYFPDQSHLPNNLDMTILYKDYPDTVDKINARYPINGDLAGQKYPLYKLPENLQVKYPDSVMIDERGFARFEPYSIKIIKSKELIGDHDKDFQLADRISGYETRPKEYTWHHVEDGETMLLVPKDLHKAIRHTGGAAIIRVIKGNKNGK